MKIRIHSRFKIFVLPFALLFVLALAVACSSGATASPTSPAITRSASPSPVVATPTPVAGSQTPLAVTLADNGNTISLKIGNTFLLKLGDERIWDVTVSDQSVVSRVPNITVIRGAQGVYTAKNAGKTTLSANGKVNCQPGQVCPQNILVFRVDILVE